MTSSWRGDSRLEPRMCPDGRHQFRKISGGVWACSTVDDSPRVSDVWIRGEHGTYIKQTAHWLVLELAQELWDTRQADDVDGGERPDAEKLGQMATNLLNRIGAPLPASLRKKQPVNRIVGHDGRGRAYPLTATLETCPGSQTDDYRGVATVDQRRYGECRACRVPHLLDGSDYLVPHLRARLDRHDKTLGE